ncbi:hypothetical protein EQG49_12540 [Periweissella cryptocerci]|uniref:Uncharacterized protein n=1 Tax=Periweissella cryptocerci TaxID=2506420 RepID=A0A4V1AIZ5_9LACO|nr:PD-(D/E)XK nuclease family protein [Periweissella cryptocerci]QBO37225.1 hypothetical protein EQG49_12540 [Periweissella cryptocerci]
MTLTFITGSASRDHQGAMLTKVNEQATTTPNEQLFYLVPNHIKFESEVEILTRYGTLRHPNTELLAESQLQVFSLTRLAWYFMANTPAYRTKRLSSAGLFMLVKRVLVEKVDTLTIFQQLARKPGFIDQLAQQISELRMSQITGTELLQIASIEASDYELSAKLHDLAIIADALQGALGDVLLTSADMMNIFSQWLQQADLSTAHFYFEGFSAFTIQEREIVEVLIKKADVTIAMIADDQPLQGALFNRPKKIMAELTDWAKMHAISVRTEVVNTPRLGMQPGLLALEKFWLELQQTGRVTKQPELAATDNLKPIQIYRADSRQTELEQVARMIRQWVAVRPDFRYRDVLVIARDLTQYATMIAPTFNRYQIPIFTDLDYAMKSHPLVEFIGALFTLQDSYAYQPLMRLLKTELLVPTDMTAPEFRDALDVTENYILANNPRRDDWESTKAWVAHGSFGSEDDWEPTPTEAKRNTQINQIRHLTVTALTKFRDVMQAVKNGREAASALYHWLDDFGVIVTLQKWRNQKLEQGEITAAGQPEEVWQMLTSTLDEYVNLWGDQPFSSDDFLEILLAGFSGAKFSGIPSTIDKVQISEAGIVQMNHYKAVIMIGGTRQNLPAQIQTHALLSDADREKLTPMLADFEVPRYLRDTSREQMAAEPLLAYLSWLHASQAVVLTFPSKDTSDKPQLMSPYYAQIQQAFNLPIGQWTASPLKPTTDEQLWQYIGTPRSAVSYVAELARELTTQQQPFAPGWNALYRYLLEKEPIMQSVMTALNYHNQAVQLRPEFVNALFGQELHTSISQLEAYNNNPYEYFLRYGLRLQERQVFELSPADTGQFFHSVLDLIMKRLIAEDQTPGQLSKQAATALVNELSGLVLMDPTFKILQSSPRLQYIQRQLVNTLQTTFSGIVSASRANNSVPFATEVQFGRINSTKGWQPLVYDLGQGRKLDIRGKIDRVDVDQVGEKLFVSVVDYKSGDKKFDYRDAYHGMALQLLTYLQALQLNAHQFAKPIEIGGAVFAHIYNPKTKLKDLSSKQWLPDVLDAAGLEVATKAQQEAFQYHGLLVENPDFLSSLDDGLEENGAAKHFGFKIKANGDFSKTGDLIAESDLELLLEHNQAILIATGANILAGEFPIFPAKWSDQKTALQYSPFKPVMSFDALIDNKYHLIESLSSKEILALLQAEKEGNNA